MSSNLLSGLQYMTGSAIGTGACLATGHALYAFYHSPRCLELSLAVKKYAIETALPFFKDPPFPLKTFNLAAVRTFFYANGALTAAGGAAITFIVCGTCFIFYRRSVQQELNSMTTKRDEAQRETERIRADAIYYQSLLQEVPQSLANAREQVRQREHELTRAAWQAHANARNEVKSLQKTVESLQQELQPIHAKAQKRKERRKGRAD